MLESISILIQGHIVDLCWRHAFFDLAHRVEVRGKVAEVLELLHSIGRARVFESRVGLRACHTVTRGQFVTGYSKV